MEGEPMMKQAQHVWAMLDDMADNDPQAYRKFIDKQMEERKKFQSPPEPHMCVQVTMTKPEKVPFYINFCSWQRIPPPANPEESVKVTGSAVSQMEDDKGKVAVTAVAFAPKILEEYGRFAENVNDRDTLINIAMDFIEKQHGDIKLNRQYKILDKEHKGSLKVIQKSLTQVFESKSKPVDDELAEVLKNYGSLATDSPETLIGQLNTDSDQSETVTKTNGLSDHLSGISLSTDPRTSKPGLIEVVADDTVTFPEPEYSIEELKGDNSGMTDFLQLRITLPGVASVRECELDISQDDVCLEVEGKYELKLNLPKTIIDSEARAKFIRKTSCLSIKMPVKPS